VVVRLLSLGQQRPYGHVVAGPPAGGPCGPRVVSRAPVASAILAVRAGRSAPLSPQDPDGAAIAS
jgi:hypothetical protein